MPESSRRAIADKNNNVIVSAPSAWEIATKVRLGKLKIAVGIVESFPEYLAQQNFDSLLVGIEH